jgi:DNA topoisomerase IB
MAKFDRLIDSRQVTTKARRTIRRHISERGLGRRKVLATVAYLLDDLGARRQPRVRAQQQSYGLMMPQDRHVTFSEPSCVSVSGQDGQERKLKQ